MRKFYDEDKGVKIILSIIYPLGAFLYSWKDLKSRSTYWVFFIFFICYGFCFNAVWEAADSFRYVQDLSSFSINPSENWKEVVRDYFSSQSNTKDIFHYAVFYLTSLLSGNNPRLFFALVAVIFGFFYIRSLRIITEEETYQNTPFFFLLALIFTFSNPCFNINGVRFYTAAWVAVYATFQLLIKKNRIYILLLLVLPLIHGSFYIFLFFFLIAYLVRRFYKVLPYLFFISFFFTDIALHIVPNVSDYLPPFLQIMIFNYTESNEAVARMSHEAAVQEALYARILMGIPRYFHVILIFLLVRSREFFKDKMSKEMLGFILGYGVLVNISSMIPSMIRFWCILMPLYVYLWVHNSPVMIKYKRILQFYPIIALYPAFRVLRNMYYTTDPILYFSNSIHIIIKGLLY